MKIVHVVRQFSPSVGGLESAVLSLARAQRSELGIASHVVTLDRVFGRPDLLPAAEQIGGVPVVRLPWRGSSRYPLAPGVLRHLQAADVVHVHAIDFFFDFLALTRPLHRRPMVASTHGGFFHTERFARLKKLWFNTATRASALAYHRIIACSHSDRTLFQNLCGERLVTIENGIDTEKFAGAAANTQTRTIIYFGRFTGHKRIALLFPILAALRGLHPDWRLILAGREAELTIPQLMAMAQAAGVADAVSCISAPGDAQLQALIGMASFFACLSSYEGFGLAAVEAMSAGLVPVLSDIAPFRILCDGGTGGMIVDPEQPHAIAQALEANILNDAENAARKIGLINAVRKYDWKQVARQYAAIYNEACPPQPHPAAIDIGSRV